MMGFGYRLYPSYELKTFEMPEKPMSFYQEPTHYEKTIISDLQGAWEVLRDEVIKEHDSKDCSLSVTGFVAPSLTFCKSLRPSNVLVGVANPDQLRD
ncbi:MAG: hypothetical protein WCP01_09350 [Methylococcaceae bacterium]|jgi:hypothetical protein